jgi:basic amino acid/polyamine antiporter, APA family
MTEVTELKRAIGPTQLMFYGIGSMLGAGIYGLVGTAAGQMGGAVWMAFAVSMVAALLTGVSYASLASRHPRAAGAAYVTQRAYRKPWLSYLVGLTVVCSGLASMATGSKVIAANLNELFGSQLPISLLAVGFLLVVAGIVYRGITESLWANTVCTVIEATGLVLIIVVGMRFWGQHDLTEVPPAPNGAAMGVTGGLLLQGAVLTFFSFIGFEDMINVAEEVRNPQRNVPIALIGAMIVVSLIYMAVSITAVSVVPWQELAAAKGGPLKLVVERAAPWFPGVGFTLITIFAVANTALVNYVMGSRLLYGMSKQGLLPEPLSRIQASRRTPYVAIAVLFAIIALLQFTGDIGQLASATVLLLLFVFILVNGALIVLKRREGDLPGCFNAPIFVPALGILICTAMLVKRGFLSDDLRPSAIAGGLIVGILALYALTARGRAEKVAAYWEAEDGRPNSNI